MTPCAANNASVRFIARSRAAALKSWLPSRQKPWLETFLLGVAYHLRLVQAARAADGAAQVRLTRLGRSLLGLPPNSVSV